MRPIGMVVKGPLYLTMYVSKNRIRVSILENYRYDKKSAGWIWNTEYEKTFTQDEMIKLLMDSGMLKKLTKR